MTATPVRDSLDDPFGLVGAVLPKWALPAVIVASAGVTLLLFATTAMQGVADFLVVAAVVFGAYGTALALVGTQLNILPLKLYSLISETGSDFADFLLGIGSNYNQADSQSYYPRHKYVAVFAEDSWRMKPGWTLNYGVRLDVMRYWSEKFNQIPTLVQGQQSEVFPDAPASIVYPTDKGIPPTLVPGRNRWSPRVGLAYSPQSKGGLIEKLTGGAGNTSIRAGFGMFYSVIEGNTVFPAAFPARFAAAKSSCTARLPASSPAWIAFEIRTMSMSITRPAPSVVWPTSELPIWPSGRPTEAPEVSTCACG
jgi:hypothetical protein